MIIVFAGNDQDGEVIKFAQNALGEAGSLTAVVRHDDDDEEERRPASRSTSSSTEYGLRIPDIVQQLNEEAPAP